MQAVADLQFLEVAEMVVEFQQRAVGGLVDADVAIGIEADAPRLGEDAVGQQRQADYPGAAASPFDSHGGGIAGGSGRAFDRQSDGAPACDSVRLTASRWK